MRIHLRRFVIATLFLASLGLIGELTAQQIAGSSSPQLALTNAVPQDPEITVGTFPNGLRYYVRANKKPERRAELRLVVRAGSVLEEDDQQGLAHFVEHMAFNGTHHFPKSEIVSFIESLGMRFGADLNASTGFDETSYRLTVPTDKPEALDKAFLILEDWAHNVSFDPAEIEKERGVIMEEWRLSRGAGARMEDKLYPLIFKGSRYGERLPIGKTEIIQNAKPERLIQFYKDWYRTDLMAVVAVGDFDKATVENLIKAHFGSMPATAAPKPRPYFQIADHPGTVYAVMTDKEATAASIQVDHIVPARLQGTVGHYRQTLMDALFSGMLAGRFSEIAQKPDAPFLSASVGRGLFLDRGKETATLRARVKEDGIERGLEALQDEAERTARFGFTATELDRQKQNIARSFERMLTESVNRVSSSRAAEYIRNFLRNESLPTTAEEVSMAQRFLQDISLEELNRVSKEWFTDQNRMVVVTAPEKAGLALPDEGKLATVLKLSSNKELKPFVDSGSTGALLDSIPTPGTIVSSTTNEAIGITEWKLSNGVRVLLKPTTFREDDIVFRATSPGGTSLASDADFIPASTAVRTIASSGLGAFNAVDLRKVMTGKVAAASPVIGELEEGLSGGTSRKDIETLFQLIYLRFTQPRADPAAFSVQASQAKAALLNQATNPAAAFSEMLTTTMYQNHLRRRPPTLAMVDQWNLDKSMAFYKERFADASDFTFVFVGSFDLPLIQPFVERYVASLPSIRRQENWKDVGARPPKGVVEKQVEKGIEPKSQTALVFTGPFEYDESHRVAIRAMAHILQTRLLQVIREELGGTYSISAGAGYQKFPDPEYSITIQFGSDPQRKDGLIQRVFQELEQFKTDGPTEKQLTDEKEALQRDFELNSKVNAYLLSQIVAKLQHGEELTGVWELPSHFKKLDAATIQQAAKTYLNMSNHVQVTLVPQSR